MEDLLVRYIIIGFVSSFLYMIMIPNGPVLKLFYPSWMYENTKINKFGCIITCIVLWILFPIWSIIAFVWWIFHVGRKD